MVGEDPLPIVGQHGVGVLGAVNRPPSALGAVREDDIAVDERELEAVRSDEARRRPPAKVNWFGPPLGSFPLATSTSRVTHAIAARSGSRYAVTAWAGVLPAKGAQHHEIHDLRMVRIVHHGVVLTGIPSSQELVAADPQEVARPLVEERPPFFATEETDLAVGAIRCWSPLILQHSTGTIQCHLTARVYHAAGRYTPLRRLAAPTPSPLSATSAVGLLVPWPGVLGHGGLLRP